MSPDAPIRAIVGDVDEPLRRAPAHRPDVAVLGRRAVDDPVSGSIEREYAVLAAIAEGPSDSGIRRSLFLSHAWVEKYVTGIPRKLRVSSGAADHRRVLAVPTSLRRGTRF